MKPRTALVYGGDHSPWVQAVLLGLHARGVPTRVVTVPPLGLLLDSGIYMPAVRFDDEGPWLLDSAAILERVGFARPSESDRRALLILFMGGAARRVDATWRFWSSWQWLRDDAASPFVRALHHLLRPLVVMNFFVLITLARRRVPMRSDEQLRADFAYWEDRLAESGPFLGGDAPETADLQLFGQVQMLASIPGPSFEVLREAPGLDRVRAWVERMQARWVDYPHLYSGAFFEPAAPGPAESSASDRLFYWTGVLLLVLALPLSLIVTLLLIGRVSRKGLRNPPRVAAG